jgi:hypothetical protein
MADAIVSFDTSSVVEGKLEELKLAMKELAEFVESNEPKAIVYSIYLNEDETLMTVVQVHPDSASMEYHMDVARPVFAKFRDFIKLETIDIYGKPSLDLLDQLRRKAEMLGAATLDAHQLQAGFVRARAG